MTNGLKLTTRNFQSVYYTWRRVLTVSAGNAMHVEQIPPTQPPTKSNHCKLIQHHDCNWVLSVHDHTAINSETRITCMRTLIVSIGWPTYVETTPPKKPPRKSIWFIFSFLFLFSSNVTHLLNGLCAWMHRPCSTGVIISTNLLQKDYVNGDEIKFLSAQTVWVKLYTVGD